MKKKTQLRVIIWLFISIRSIFAIYSNSFSPPNSMENSESFKNGIVMRDSGYLAFYNAHYIIPLRLFKDQIIGQYTELHAQFMALYELVDPKEKTNMTDSLVSLILDELTSFKHDYFHSLDSVSNLFTWSVKGAPNRSKRGLVNGVGEIARFLFGTAMDTDVSALHETIAKLYTSNREQELEINLHNQILKVSTDKINKIEVVQAKLTKLVLDLADKLENLNNITQVIEEQLYNSNAFSSLILALMNLNSKTNVLKRGIESMMYGELSPAIIDNKSLQKLLEIIKNQGHHLILQDQNMPLSFYYKLASVHSIFEIDSSSILFMVAFPINYDESETFSLKTVHSMFLESSYPTLFTRYKLHKYLAMNEAQRYIETDDLSYCQKVKSVHVCPIKNSFYEKHNESCALRLTKNITPFEPVCSTELVQLNQPVFQYIRNYWYYAIPAPTTLRIICKDEYWHDNVNVQNLTLKGSGRIVIKHGCVGQGDGIYLMSSSRNIYKQGRNITLVQEIMPNLKIKEKMSSLPITKKLNVIQLLKSSDTADLNKLTARLKVLHTLDNTYSTDISYHSALAYTAIIIAVIAIGLALVLINAIINEFKETESLDEVTSHSFEQLPMQEDQLKTSNPHLYENDIFMNQRSTKITNPMYMQMEDNNKIVENNLDKH